SIIFLFLIPPMCWLVLGMLKYLFHIPKRYRKINLGVRKKLFPPLSLSLMIFYTIANENFERFFKREGLGWTQSILHPLLICTLAYGIASIIKLFIKSVS